MLNWEDFEIYDKDDLGVNIRGGQAFFKLWAPTAYSVTLNLFEDGNGCFPYRSIDMKKGERGVWSLVENCPHGTYYTYTVYTSLGVHEAVDPYAKAVGINGARGMVVDLSLTDPDGFSKDRALESIENYSEAIIWEIHVRDFSNKIEGSSYKGKYLAFTERGLINEHGVSVGLDYLKNLGITHVHLLPVSDYATVDEENPDDDYNWGYDPENYNAPEGSYATNAYDGALRIKELKSLVMALHSAGIGVILDVVYNHTYYLNSSLNKTVPDYYYRVCGRNASSGCGNDTASERAMFGKFMVDSASYWMKEYHLDGLRFDLMGLCDLETMKKIEVAIHNINPHAIIYGEGWSMGTGDGVYADQKNINKIRPTGLAIGSVAVFNDAIRDGLKGSAFSPSSRGYINGAPEENLSKILFGVRGGKGLGVHWSVEDGMVINYMSAHDNHTLWDKLALSNPCDSVEKRLRMQRLGAAILMISRGTPFWQGGEEMLRSKKGVADSYRSPDDINNIDWSVLSPDSEEYKMMLYYKGLIEMRRGCGIFTDLSAHISHTELGGGAIAIDFDDLGEGRACVLLNPTDKEISFELNGEFYLLADSERASDRPLSKESGKIGIEPLGIRIYANEILINE